MCHAYEIKLTDTTSLYLFRGNDACILFSLLDFLFLIGNFGDSLAFSNGICAQVCASWAFGLDFTQVTVQLVAGVGKKERFAYKTQRTLKS